MGKLRYVSHPEVAIDPDVPVPDWDLSACGRERARALLERSWVPAVRRVISSAEPKAIQTAEVLTEHLGYDLEIRATTGEIDRSSTGYVPAQRHEQLADRLFAHPTRSAEGWETAVDAQERIVAALSDLFEDEAGVVVVVGHGGVGTLLRCHLGRLPIDRRHDQPTGGHYWTFDRHSGSVVHGWRPIDGPVRSSVSPDVPGSLP